MVIVALDFTSKKEVEAFLAPFEHPIYVKIGMSLFYAEGPQIITYIKSLGHKIFLDLKLHDIPYQVGEAIKSIATLGVDMINVHAKGGLKMMKEAKKTLSNIENPPLLIAVTELTSTDQHMLLHELGQSGSVLSSVLRFASLAKEAGLDGVVCSALESIDIKERCGSDFLTITPGIRYQEANDDQVRVVTPMFAKENQADYIVVGRPITQDNNPKVMYNKIQFDFIYGGTL